MRNMTCVWVAALLALAAGSGCGDNQDPEGAAELWRRIHDLDYRSFERAPGYETTRSSNAPHGDRVDIYVNGIVAEALKGPAITEWPQGSLIVKDGKDGNTLELVAAMEKRENGWFWAEWDADGDALYSGKPSLCVDCHRSGDDSVLAFAFPE